MDSQAFESCLCPLIKIRCRSFVAPVLASQTCFALVQSFCFEAIFVGWLVSATMLDKALEAWMHHDASDQPRGTRSNLDPPSHGTCSKRRTVLQDTEEIACGSRQCRNVVMWHLRVVSRVPLGSEGSYLEVF